MGRFLALTLTLLLLAVLWVSVAMPLIQWHSDRADALVQRAALLQRMEFLVGMRAGLQQQANAAAASGTGEATLLEGETDSMASASMQETLQALFLQAGIQLNSVETLPGDAVDAYRRIRLRVTFNASWPVLMTLLKDIEFATPALLVDELQVEPALHRISTAPGTFDITCSIFGFRSERARTTAR
jgi:Type II secretion system (T2SS), protein M subtype b